MLLNIAKSCTVEFLILNKTLLLLLLFNFGCKVRLDLSLMALFDVSQIRKLFPCMDVKHKLL